MKKLLVTAKVKIKPLHIDEAVDVLKILARNSNAEPGSISYEILHSNDEENTFMTFEVWESAEAESLHWQTKELNESLKHLKPLLLEEAVIRKFSAI